MVAILLRTKCRRRSNLTGSFEFIKKRVGSRTRRVLPPFQCRFTWHKLHHSASLLWCPLRGDFDGWLCPLFSRKDPSLGSSWACRVVSCGLATTSFEIVNDRGTVAFEVSTSIKSPCLTGLVDVWANVYPHSQDLRLCLERIILTANCFMYVYSIPVLPANLPPLRIVSPAEVSLPDVLHEVTSWKWVNHSKSLI